MGQFFSGGDRPDKQSRGQQSKCRKPGGRRSFARPVARVLFLGNHDYGIAGFDPAAREKLRRLGTRFLGPDFPGVRRCVRHARQARSQVRLCFPGLSSGRVHAVGKRERNRHFLIPWAVFALSYRERRPNCHGGPSGVFWNQRGAYSGDPGRWPQLQQLLCLAGELSD